MSKKANAVELEKEALAIIDARGLVFIDDVCAYISCSRATFYNHNLDKLDSIKDALTRNKVSKKVALRKNWEESTNATLQMGLYKLLATPEELAALSMQHVDHTTKGEKLPTTIIKFVGDSNDGDTDTPEVSTALEPEN